MEDREALTHLRSIVVRGDHAELVTALRQKPWPADSLQLIGDGLLAAVRDRRSRRPAMAPARMRSLSQIRLAGLRASPTRASRGQGLATRLKPGRQPCRRGLGPSAGRDGPRGDERLAQLPQCVAVRHRPPVQVGIADVAGSAPAPSGSGARCSATELHAADSTLARSGSQRSRIPKWSAAIGVSHRWQATRRRIRRRGRCCPCALRVQPGALLLSYTSMGRTLLMLVAN